MAGNNNNNNNAIIAASAQLISSSLGAMAASNTSKKDRALTREMLQKQQDFARETNALQQHYQDKVNNQNFEWNRESNVRQRIEEAGYNPYLYKDGATGSAQGTNFDTGTSSLPGATPHTIAPYIANIPSSILGVLSQHKGVQSQQIDNDTREYALAKQKANDDVTGESGQKAYLAQGVKDAADADVAVNNAKISRIDAAFKQLDEQFALDAATDDDGEPMLDGNGQPITNYRAEKQAHLDSIRAGLDKLKKDMQEADGRIGLMEIEKKIKTYFHKNIQPEELEKIKAEFRKIMSDIETNEAYQNNLNAGAAAHRAAAALSFESARTENALRPYSVGLTNWQGKLSQQGALAKQMENAATRGKMAADADFNNSGYGRFVNTYLAPTIDRVVSPILGTAGTLGVGYGSLQHGLQQRALRKAGKPNKIGFRQ